MAMPAPQMTKQLPKRGASPPNGTTCPFPLIQAGIRLRARDPLGVIDEAQAHLMCECKQEFRARAPSEYRSGDVGDIRLNCNGHVSGLSAPPRSIRARFGCSARRQRSTLSKMLPAPRGKG